MRKLAAVLMVAALAASVTGCGQEGENGGPSNEATLRISMIAKGTDDHWMLVRTGALAAGKDLGAEVTFNAPDTENEGDKQLNLLQVAINEKPDGIGFAPQDGAQDAAPALIKEADDGSIPVVAFDTPVEASELPIATIASDNTGIGAQAAEELSKLLGGKGKVAMVTQGVVGTAAQRRDGFVDWMKANAPGIEVVDIQNGEADPAKSRDKAQGILQAHPDLDGMVGTSNYSTIAIADEVAAKGSDCIVVGVDAAPDVLTLLEEGKIAGIVTQNPYEIGYETVKVLIEAANGTDPKEKSIVTDSVWVTKSNMNDDEVKKVLGSD